MPCTCNARGVLYKAKRYWQAIAIYIIPAGIRTKGRKSPREFNWDVQGANRCDEMLAELFAGGARQFVVQRVEAGQAGELALLLEGGLTLQIFPNDSLEGEHWRLFRPGSDAPHSVFTGKGLERH